MTQPSWLFWLSNVLSVLNFVIMYIWLFKMQPSKNRCYLFAVYLGLAVVSVILNSLAAGSYDTAAYTLFGFFMGLMAWMYIIDGRFNYLDEEEKKNLNMSYAAYSRACEMYKAANEMYSEATEKFRKSEEIHTQYIFDNAQPNGKHN